MVDLNLTSRSEFLRLATHMACPPGKGNISGVYAPCFGSIAHVGRLERAPASASDHVTFTELRPVRSPTRTTCRSLDNNTSFALRVACSYVSSGCSLHFRGETDGDCNKSDSYVLSLLEASCPVGISRNQTQAELRTLLPPPWTPEPQFSVTPSDGGLV